ncbi:MAG: GWxTD domain-containing protein [Acidobacteriota bacterium]|jgi:GWxTD domain-containing protein|nr:GWxTD domain-containing protein [Acidobacteriota bacterium]
MIRPYSISRLVLMVMLGFLAGSCAANRPDPVVEPQDDQFYQLAGPIMTARENRIYRNLTSPAARERFIEYFWEIRDPNPLTAENEFRSEMLRRHDHVQRYFQEGQRPGWRTDRGRFFMILGPPDEEDRNVQTTDPRLQGRIIDWYYYGLSGASQTTFSGGGFRLRFVDENGFGIYRMDERYLPLRVMDILEDLKFNMIVKRNADSPFPEAIDFQVDSNPATSTVDVVFSPNRVAFERREERIFVHLYVTVLVFSDNEEINRFSRDWEAGFDADQVLQENFRFHIPVAVSLKPGKYTLDVVLTDMLSGRKSRRLGSVKVKD